MMMYKWMLTWILFSCYRFAVYVSTLLSQLFDKMWPQNKWVPAPPAAPGDVRFDPGRLLPLPPLPLPPPPPLPPLLLGPGKLLLLLTATPSPLLLAPDDAKFDEPFALTMSEPATIDPDSELLSYICSAGDIESRPPKLAFDEAWWCCIWCWSLFNISSKLRIFIGGVRFRKPIDVGSFSVS